MASAEQLTNSAESWEILLINGTNKSSGSRNFDQKRLLRVISWFGESDCTWGTIRVYPAVDLLNFTNLLLIRLIRIRDIRHIF